MKGQLAATPHPTLSQQESRLNAHMQRDEKTLTKSFFHFSVNFSEVSCFEPPPGGVLHLSKVYTLTEYRRCIQNIANVTEGRKKMTTEPFLTKGHLPLVRSRQQSIIRSAAPTHQQSTAAAAFNAEKTVIKLLACFQSVTSPPMRT